MDFPKTSYEYNFNGNDTISKIGFATSCDNPESNYIVVYPRDTKAKINEFIIKKILKDNNPDIILTLLHNKPPTLNDSVIQIQGKHATAAIQYLARAKIMNQQEAKDLLNPLKKLEDCDVQAKIVKYSVSIQQYFSRKDFEHYMKQETFDKAQVVLHCKKTAEFKTTTSDYKTNFIDGVNLIYKMYHGQLEQVTESELVEKTVPNIKVQQERILNILFPQQKH